MANAYGGPSGDEQRPNPMVFGTPMQPKPADTGGAMVAPQFGAVTPQFGAPSMAKGGAIPDGDDDDALDSNAGVQDDTTTKLNQALQTVNQVMMYGLKQHGLPPQQKKQQDDQDNSSDSAIPDDSGGDAAPASYAEGGAIDDDVAAHEQEFPDTPAATADTGPEVQPQPGYANPPEGNPIQQGAQATESFLGNTLGPQGPIPDPNQGNEVPPQAPQQQDGQERSMFGTAPLSTGGITSRVISWLQGSGKAAAEVKAAEDQSHGNPAEKAVGAVDKITNDKGADAGVDAILYNKAAYNAKAGFAYAALNGYGGKPPDLTAATKAATQATPHLLDGTLLTFAPDKDGVTASAGGETIKLTVPQFNQFLDIRKSGQYDNIFEQGGGLIALKQIMKGPGEPPAAQQTGTGTIGRPAPAGGPGPQSSTVRPRRQELPEEARSNDQQAMASNQADRYVNMGHDVTLLRSPTYDRQNPAAVTRSQNTPERVFTPEERRDMALTPAQRRQDEASAAKYASAENVARIRGPETRTIAGDTAVKVQGMKNEGGLATQGLRNEGGLERAKLRTDSQMQIEARKLQQRVKEEEGRQGRAVMSTQEKTVIGMAAAGQMKALPPGAKEWLNSRFDNAAPQAPAAPQVAAPAAQQGAGPITVQSPADAHKLAPGTVYITPDGRRFTR